MTELDNVVSLDEWKGEKLDKLESFVPKNFSNLEEFLGYCKIHSESERALFHIIQVNAICKMAGYPIYDINDKLTSNFYPIHESEMNEILEIIRNRKNSIEVKSERFD